MKRNLRSQRYRNTIFRKVYFTWDIQKVQLDENGNKLYEQKQKEYEGFREKQERRDLKRQETAAAGASCAGDPCGGGGGGDCFLCDDGCLDLCCLILCCPIMIFD